jgi:hypothetical protein
MYYADSYIDSAPDEDVRHLAMQSSLREVAWGIAYYDFWRPIRPTDRATAMEQAWLTCPSLFLLHLALW